MARQSKKLPLASGKVPESNTTPEFWKWLQENLFTHLSFDNKFFPDEVVIYAHQSRVSIPQHIQAMEEEFTKEDLYGAVMKACVVYKMQRDALWFHVNIVDLAVWVFEDYKPYPYPLSYPEKPLSTLFERMVKYPADQGGVTYLGLLSDSRKWLLLLEHECHSDGTSFKIRFLGPDYLCKTVRSFVKTKSA